MPEKKQKTNRTIWQMVISVFVMFLVIGLLVLGFMSRNRERITQQNQQYLENAASLSMKIVEEIFDNATKSSRMVSRLYELQLDAPEFDYRLLNDISEPTPFDHIRFVSPDGISWSGDGATVDCRDREYYTEGIRGKSGICYIESSRFNAGSILIFYTPLYYHGEIIGVVNGVLDTDRLSSQLISSFFGKDSATCVALPDGTIVAASWQAQDHTSGLQIMPFGADSISPERMQEVQSAIREGKSLSFRYNGTMGDGNAYMGPLANGQFVLVQTLPSMVSQEITARANQDALELEMLLVVLFLCYIAYLAVYYISRNRKLAMEKKDLSQIVDSVKRLYRRFIVFDLERDTYEYLGDDAATSFGLPVQGRCAHWLETLHRAQQENPGYWGIAEELTADNLRQMLNRENWYAHWDYRTTDERWERLSLIKLDMDSDRTDRVLGAVEDITDTKLRDEESRKALETAFHAAEAASRAKSDFLSRMSHDIRTPMNAIIGLTAIMGTHLDERERVVDCLGKITSSSKHLLGLINEVLDMSKIESGKLVLSESEFSLPALVDELLDVVQPMVNAKRQTLTVQLHDIQHEDVIGDSLRLQQVCVNILSNAVKYTHEGGSITFTLTEHRGKQPLLSDYEFAVEDTGIGMTKEFMERIFVPFERAEDERVSDVQGTGLGMSITQSIVHLMGGVISVESEVGKGSRFTVHVSLKRQACEVSEEERLIGLPVLVADDDQISCESAAEMLREMGMTGEWVLSGREALECVKDRHARQEDYFAVILDWKMPGMDGVETTRAIRREVGPDVPIIVLSAYDWSEIENEARAAGVNAFIGKPLFKSRLRGVLAGFMSEKETQGGYDPLHEMKKRDYSGKRALLVEDNALNREIAQEILEMTGITVDVVTDGKQAVERFSASDEGTYDIVFMDIQMPVMNGYEATRAIRSLQREDALTTPIVAMSANTFSEDVQMALESGMNQHIGKPLDMEHLLDTLDRWLNHRMSKNVKIY